MHMIVAPAIALMMVSFVVLAYYVRQAVSVYLCCFASRTWFYSLHS